MPPRKRKALPKHDSKQPGIESFLTSKKPTTRKLQHPTVCFHHGNQILQAEHNGRPFNEGNVRDDDMEALLSNVRLRQQEKPARPLNQQQREAAHTDSSKPVMILAGAGSGKTSTLVARLLDMALCQGVPLNQVLMLTFTVKSTMEMRERLEHEGISKALLKPMTIHSWGYGLLSKYHRAAGFESRPSIIGDADAKRVAAVAKSWAEFAEFKANFAKLLGVPDTTSWPRLLNQLLRAHPSIHAHVKACVEEVKAEEEQHRRKREGKVLAAAAAAVSAGEGGTQASRGGHVGAAKGKRSKEGSEATQHPHHPFKQQQQQQQLRIPQQLQEQAAAGLHAAGGGQHVRQTQQQKRPLPSNSGAGIDVRGSIGAAPHQNPGGPDHPSPSKRACLQQAPNPRPGAAGATRDSSTGAAHHQNLGGLEHPSPSKQARLQQAPSPQRPRAAAAARDSSASSSPAKKMSKKAQDQAAAAASCRDIRSFLLANKAAAPHPPASVSAMPAGPAYTTAAATPATGSISTSSFAHATDRQRALGEGHAGQPQQQQQQIRGQGQHQEQQRMEEQEQQRHQEWQKQQQQQQQQQEQQRQREKQQEQQQERQKEQAAAADTTLLEVYLSNCFARLAYAHLTRHLNEPEKGPITRKEEEACIAAAKCKGTAKKKDLTELCCWLETQKRSGFWPEDFLGITFEHRFFKIYQDLLKKMQKVDFNDLLILTAQILENNRGIAERTQKQWRWLLIDEYQDCNPLQVRIANILQQERGHITVVGDDAQSIYRFRGALAGVFQAFQDTYDRQGMLSTSLVLNYRSRPRILGLADRLLEDAGCKKKQLLPTKAENGQLVHFTRTGTPKDEAKHTAAEIMRLIKEEGVQPHDIGILYRCFKSGYQRTYRVMEDALAARGIPYTVIRSKGLLQQAEVQDVLAYLRLVTNPNDDEAFARACNTPARGIPKEMLDEMLQLRDLRLQDAIEQLPWAARPAPVATPEAAGAGASADTVTAGVAAAEEGRGQRQAQHQRQLDHAAQLGGPQHRATLRAIAEDMLHGGEPVQSARRLKALRGFVALIDELHVVVSGLSLSEAMVQVVLSSGYVQHKEQQHAKKAAKASKQSDAGKERQAEAEGAGQQEGTKRDGSSSHAQQEVGVKRKRPGWMLDEDEEEEGNELQGEQQDHEDKEGEENEEEGNEAEGSKAGGGGRDGSEAGSEDESEGDGGVTAAELQAALACAARQGLGKAARPEANQESPGAGSDEQPQGQQTTSALHRVLKAVRRMAPLFVLAERFMHEEWPGLLHDAGVPSDTGGGLGGGAADVREGL